MILFKHSEGAARFVIHHFVCRFGHHLHEVHVSRGIFYQEHEMPADLTRTFFDAFIGDKIRFAAKDRLERRRRAQLFYFCDIVRFFEHAHIPLPLSMTSRMYARVFIVWSRLFVVPFTLEALHIVFPLLHIKRCFVVFATRQIEIGHAKHIAVVGKSKRRHMLLVRSIDHSLDGGRRIQNRKVRMVMEVNKCHTVPLSNN